MKEKIKLALRRWAIRLVILLVDRAEEWLHQAQVRLREKLAVPVLIGEQTGAREGVRLTRPAQSELLSLSAEKREQHDPRNSKARPARRADDSSRAAQLDQQTAGSASASAGDAQRLSTHRHYEVSRKGAHETFTQWEARRSGVAVISKREAREARTRRRFSASDFDRRFAHVE